MNVNSAVVKSQADSVRSKSNRVAVALINIKLPVKSCNAIGCVNCILKIRSDSLEELIDLSILPSIIKAEQKDTSDVELKFKLNCPNPID